MLHKFGGSVRLALKDAFPELKIDGILFPPPRGPNKESAYPLSLNLQDPRENTRL